MTKSSKRPKKKQKKRCRSKACGRKYTEADARSNRKNVEKRKELNKEARRRGIYGKRKKMGKDLSHHSDGSMKLESVSANRKRNGKDGKSTLKSSRRPRRRKKK